MNLTKLAQKLKELDSKKTSNEFSKLLWKPVEGTQTIRILPYKFNPESSFIELKFYYNLGGKHYLAPCTFGKPDPIQEHVETLLASGNPDERALAEKLKPTVRTYCPIIVRGQEELGVRYWGFGVQVFRQLAKLCLNPKWGDITSFTEGNDLDVEFHKIGNKRNAQGEPIPDTTITPDPTKSPVVDPTRRDLMEKVKDQVDILKIFPLKSYEELNEAVELWLHPENAGNPAPEAIGPQEPDVIPPAAFAAGKPATAAPKASAPVSTTPVSENLAGEFEKFFATK